MSTTSLEVLLAVGVVGCGVVLAWVRPARPRQIGEPQHWGRARAGAPSGWVGPFGCVVAAVVLRSPVVAVGGPLVAVFVRHERGRRRALAVAEERSAMALDFVVSAASGLRAGQSLGGAVLGDGTEARRSGQVNVLRGEVVERVQAGAPFVFAVDEVLSAGSVDERLIATTIRALEATGASAGDALERVAEALGERQSSREDARTQAQHAMSSAGVLAALPVVFGLAAALAEPDVGRLYVSTWLGAGCVGVALVLIFSSSVWLQRLLRSP